MKKSATILEKKNVFVRQEFVNYCNLMAEVIFVVFFFCSEKNIYTVIKLVSYLSSQIYI